MKKWSLVVFILLIQISLAWAAEPFFTTQGPIMEMARASGIIVVNERSITVDSSTQIMDEKGRSLSLRQLRPGQWVSVQAEPDGDSGMVAKQIVLMGKK
ncbi:MAG: hypothetical protein JRH07_02560 [Deltaproteobacteria bacterium]|nr:hypothetical protein [Deltaproteobacteria bacterium]